MKLKIFQQLVRGMFVRLLEVKISSNDASQEKYLKKEKINKIYFIFFYLKNKQKNFIAKSQKNLNFLKPLSLLLSLFFL